MNIPTPLQVKDMTKGKKNVQFNKSKLSFLLLDWLTNQGWRTQFALQLTHSWREDILIIYFSKNVLLLYEIQSASFMIWTCVAVFISTGTAF